MADPQPRSGGGSARGRCRGGSCRPRSPRQYRTSRARPRPLRPGSTCAAGLATTWPTGNLNLVLGSGSPGASAGPGPGLVPCVRCTASPYDVPSGPAGGGGPPRPLASSPSPPPLLSRFTATRIGGTDLCPHLRRPGGAAAGGLPAAPGGLRRMAWVTCPTGRLRTRWAAAVTRRPLAPRRWTRMASPPSPLALQTAQNDSKLCSSRPRGTGRARRPGAGSLRALLVRRCGQRHTRLPHAGTSRWHRPPQPNAAWTLS